MYKFTIKFNDKHVQRYLAKAERELNTGGNNMMKKVGNYAYGQALVHAPFKTGALRNSIKLQQLILTKKQKSVTITTRGDGDAKRRKSFAQTSYKTFVNYLHNSNKGYLNQLNWHDKVYDFLTNKIVFDDVQKMFEVNVIRVIKQSFK